MSKLGKRLIAAAKEAVAMAKEGACKFTPGPWERGVADPTRVQCISRGEEICDTRWATEKSPIERLANACLIAAAPQLLAELQNMIDVYWGDGDGEEPPPDCIQRAQAAIVQALGNQSEAER